MIRLGSFHRRPLLLLLVTSCFMGKAQCATVSKKDEAFLSSLLSDEGQSVNRNLEDEDESTVWKRQPPQQQRRPYGGYSHQPYGNYHSLYSPEKDVDKKADTKLKAALCQSCYGGLITDTTCIYGTIFDRGCGACVGTLTCGIVDALVGEDSCIGVLSCFCFFGRIGRSSCIGVLNCAFSDFMLIGMKSCNGGVLACAVSVDSIIGDRSCNGGLGCSFSQGLRTGDNSCNGELSCIGTTALVVADSSCVGAFACANLISSNVDSWSCQGEYACSSTFPVSGNSIGKESCRGYGACEFGPGGLTGSLTVADNLLSTVDKFFTVGDWSCQGYEACQFPGDSVTIESGACNCDSCCQDLPDGCVVRSGECNNMAAISCIFEDETCTGGGGYGVKTQKLVRKHSKKVREKFQEYAMEQQKEVLGKGTSGGDVSTAGVCGFFSSNFQSFRDETLTASYLSLAIAGNISIAGKFFGAVAGNVTGDSLNVTVDLTP